MKQSKLIAINTLSGWLGMFGNVAVLIFLTKFLLNKMEAEKFGMLRYALALQASFLFLDLGIGVSLNRFVSQLVSIRDIKKLNATISFSILVFFCMGVIAALSMSGISFVLPSLVTGSSKELYSAGMLLMLCVGCALAFRFWSYAAKGILFGLQRHFIVNSIIFFAAAFRAILIVILFIIIPSSGLFTVGLCFTGSAMLEMLAMWIFVRLQLREMRLSFKIIDKGVIKEVLCFSGWVTLLGFTTMLIANAPTFLTGRFYGAEAVAFISLPLLILSQIQSIAGGFAVSVIPVASKHGALKSQGVLEWIIVRGTKFCAMMCFPLALIAVIFGRPLLEWFEKDFGWTWILLAILAPPLVIRATQRMSSAVLMGAGTVKGLALGQGVLVIAIVCMSYLFISYFKFGLYGIALGAAIPILFYDAIYKPFYACHQINIKWRTYMLKSYGLVTLGLIPCGLTAILLMRIFYPRNLIVLVIEGCFCMLIFIVSSWIFILNESERHNILGLFVRSDIPNEKITDNFNQ